MHFPIICFEIKCITKSFPIVWSLSFTCRHGYVLHSLCLILGYFPDLFEVAFFYMVYWIHSPHFENLATCPPIVSSSHFKYFKFCHFFMYILVLDNLDCTSLNQPQRKLFSKKIPQGTGNPKEFSDFLH